MARFRAICVVGVLACGGCEQLLGIDDPHAAPPVDGPAMNRDAAVDAGPKPTDAISSIPDGKASFGPARFWRVQFTSHDQSAGGGSIVLTEIAMRIGGSVPNLSTANLSTPDGTAKVDPHPKLDALTDGDLTPEGGGDYVSFFDGATLLIDLGAVQPVSSVLFTPSGFDPGAQIDPPLEWTMRSFTVCSSMDNTMFDTCTTLDGGGRLGWADGKPREFALN